MEKIGKIVSKIISGVLFLIFIIILGLLLYYFISLQIYNKKGSGYEPAFSIYTVMTGSMTPNINRMDVVVNKRIEKAEDIKVNDVITFISSSLLTPGTTITHRVIGITEDSDGEVCYQTKGDYNNVADQACAKFHNVIGKVIFKIPKLGLVQKVLATKAGWFLIVLIPALYVIVSDIVKIIKNKSSFNKKRKQLKKK